MLQPPRLPVHGVRLEVVLSLAPDQPGPGLPNLPPSPVTPPAMNLDTAENTVVRGGSWYNDREPYHRRAPSHRDQGGHHRVQDLPQRPPPTGDPMCMTETGPVPSNRHGCTTPKGSGPSARPASLGCSDRGGGENFTGSVTCPVCYGHSRCPSASGSWDTGTEGSPAGCPSGSR